MISSYPQPLQLPTCSGGALTGPHGREASKRRTSRREGRQEWLVHCHRPSTVIALLALVLHRRLRALPPTVRPQICLSDAAQRVGLRIGCRPTGSGREIALPLPQRISLNRGPAHNTGL